MHLLVAAYLDYKPPPLPLATASAPAAAPQQNAHLEALFGAAPALPEHLKTGLPIALTPHG